VFPPNGELPHFLPSALGALPWGVVNGSNVLTPETDTIALER
jgi:hypothetical protein